MSGTVPLRPLYAFMAWTGTTLALHITKYLRHMVCASGKYFEQRITNYSVNYFELHDT
jgi:hypothetical protein